MTKKAADDAPCAHLPEAHGALINCVELGLGSGSSEAPSHLIHFDGERFLGPYSES